MDTQSVYIKRQWLSGTFLCKFAIIGLISYALLQTKRFLIPIAVDGKSNTPKQQNASNVISNVQERINNITEIKIVGDRKETFAKVNKQQETKYINKNKRDGDDKPNAIIHYGQDDGSDYIKTKYGMQKKMTNVVSLNKLYLLPADDILDTMDNDTLYLIFNKYVNQYQYNCSNISRQGPWSQSGKYICADDIFKPSSPCIVYSFGSKLDFAFEVANWKSYQCQIHTFDPSLPVRKSSIPSFVHYHLIGLSGRDFIQKGPEAWRHHDNPLLETWKMQRLSTIQRSLFHTNEVIDILKIDIEGWEWDALRDILQTGALNNVKQLCLEVHFGFSFKQIKKNRKTRFKFTKNTWGNVSMKKQMKILKQLYNAGFRIAMFQTFQWGSISVKHERISTLNELSLVNINLL